MAWWVAMNGSSRLRVDVRYRHSSHFLHVPGLSILGRGLPIDDAANRYPRSSSLPKLIRADRRERQQLKGTFDLLKEDSLHCRICYVLKVQLCCSSRKCHHQPCSAPCLRQPRFRRPGRPILVPYKHRCNFLNRTWPYSALHEWQSAIPTVQFQWNSWLVAFGIGYLLFS